MTRPARMLLLGTATAAIALVSAVALSAGTDANAREGVVDAAPRAAAADRCTALKGSRVESGTVIAAEHYRAGDLLVGGVTGGTKSESGMCRARLVLRPETGSEINVELWLPDRWNNKMMGLGGGGFDGSLSPAGAGSLNKAAMQGYAVVANDAGHTPAPSVGTWAHGAPQKIVDFGHRAGHLAAVTARQVIAAFYGNGVKRAYFTGCSNGGRDGISLVSRYPNDYDAVVAGAPAIRYTEVVTQLIWYSRAAKALGTPANAQAKLDLVHKGIMAKCDKLDGVEDGILENPRACRFDLSSLACREGNASSCLSTGEIKAFEKIYGGMRWNDGRKIIDGPAYGSEGAPGNWGAWITGPVPALAGQEFYRWMVYDEPNWNVDSFDMNRDYGAALARSVPVINAGNPDISAFTRRGGKLIIYQGWDDPVITPESTIRYVEDARQRIGRKGADQVQLFMVPGMAHCGGGPGATSFDMQKPLEDWVERGVSPERILATKPDVPAGQPPFTRPLCPWPKTARYTGKGSIRDAANFTCSAGR